MSNKKDMPKNKIFRKFRIDEEIALALERRMVAMHRREALTPFIEWVLQLYCRGYLVESDDYRKEIEDQIEQEFGDMMDKRLKKGKRVHGVGHFKDDTEIDEGKRKAS